MNTFLLGTKNYDTDWYLKYGLSYKDAAKRLREWGFSFILTQNRFLPMADSAVISEVTPDQEVRYATYDDLKFREALAKEGIGYWPTLCVFFNPQALEVDPTLLPVDSKGNRMPLLDWYIGVIPSREDYVARQSEALKKAVEILSPEGIFLSFIRWPGFWELWMPHHSRSDFPDYSYDRHSLQRFSLENGIRLPSYEPIEASTWIGSHASEAWVTWKCNLITDVVRQLKEVAVTVKSDIQVMINTLPFGEADYDSARNKTFGQNLESLSVVVDIFEVMTYHQILKRPVDWIPALGQEVKRRTHKKTVCTLQVEPLYLEGMHKIENRATRIDEIEFEDAAHQVETGNLDGVVVFVWSDLLKKAILQNDTSRLEALSAAIQNRNLKLSGK